MHIITHDNEQIKTKWEINVRACLRPAVGCSFEFLATSWWLCSRRTGSRWLAHSGEKSGREAGCRNRPSFLSDSSTSDTQRTLCASEHVSQKSVRLKRCRVRERKQRENREKIKQEHSQNPTWTLFQQRTASVRMMAATQQLVMEMITIGRIWRSSGTSVVWMSAYVEI